MELQLHPERIREDPLLEKRLQPLETLRLSPLEIWQRYPQQQNILAVLNGKPALPDDPILRSAAQHYAGYYKVADTGLEPLVKLEDLLPGAQIQILKTGKPEEIFSSEQLVEWFDLRSINCSPAKFNPEKLQWLNQQYLKTADDARLAKLVAPFLEADGCNLSSGPELSRVANLLKERINTVAELADAAVYFYRFLEPAQDLRAQHFTNEAKPALVELMERLGGIEWDSHAIQDAIKAAATGNGLKMPKVAMPLRVMVTGEAQTPSINAVLELLGREETLKRMNDRLNDFPT